MDIAGLAIVFVGVVLTQFNYRRKAAVN